MSNSCCRARTWRCTAPRAKAAGCARFSSGRCRTAPTSGTGWGPSCARRANDEFELLLQPQVSLADHSLCGVEALLRWRHPVRGMLLPGAFIGVLEDHPIAEQVGDWIIDRACAATAEWQRIGLHRVRVGVNLFAAQLRSGRLLTTVAAALGKHGLTPDALELEITENTVLQYNKQATHTLRKLKALGVGIAFDDFGTGFASLSLLRKYPVTRLKIDKSFVARVDRDPGDAAIVSAVIGMAASLKLEVIAEGVETVEQEATLVRLGCHQGQGYLYGRPMTAAAIAEAFRPGGSAPAKKRRAVLG